MATRAYLGRIARGRARGLSLAEARGHGQTPEHPVRALSDPIKFETYIRRRFDALAALADTGAGRRRLGRFNEDRAKGGRGPILIEEPPDPGGGVRQRTYDRIEDAEPHLEGIPVPYCRIYLHPGGATTEIDPARSARRRAA